MGNNSTNINK